MNWAHRLPGNKEKYIAKVQRLQFALKLSTIKSFQNL